MPLPPRTQIEDALLAYLRAHGPCAASDAYAQLAAHFGLTADDLALLRGKRPRFQHEIRWAKQDLVARGLIYPPAVAGNDTWRAVEATDPLRLAEECSPHDVLLEGARERVYVNRFERNREARARCIELLGASCVVCGFNFAETYGPIGLGCIHVHHLVPLATVTDAYVVDAAADLRPVCPNCHYMLHRRDPPFSIEELRAILAHQRSHASVPTGGEDGS